MNSILHFLRLCPFFLLLLGGALRLHAGENLAEIKDALDRSWPELQPFLEERLLRTDTDEKSATLGELLPPPASPVSSRASDVMGRVNALRKAYFALNAKLLGLPEAGLRGQYAKRMHDLEEKFPPPPPPQTILTIHGPPLIADKLLKALLKGFLHAQGYLPPEEAANPDGYSLRARRPGQSATDAIAVRFTSSTEALRALSARKMEAGCDLALVSRPVQKAENDWFTQTRSGEAPLGDLTLPAYVSIMAQDGMTLVVNSSLALGSLATADLATLVEGRRPASLPRPLKWHALGGATERADLDEYFQDSLAAKPSLPRSEHPTFNEVLSAVARDASGFAVCSFGQLQAALADRVDRSGWKIVPIVTPLTSSRIGDAGSNALIRDSPGYPANTPSASNVQNVPQQPSRLAIRSDAYPLSRSFLVCLTRRRSAAAKHFRDFVAGEGQAIVRGEHFVDRGPCEAAEIARWQEETAPFLSASPNRDFLFHCDRASTPFVIKFNYKKHDVELYSSLNPESLPNIHALVDEFANTRTPGDPRKLVLIGHTDPKGHEGNLALGYLRAESLKKELEAMGLPVEEFDCPPPTGNPPRFPPTAPRSHNTMGDEQPVGLNNEEGWARDRRVEVWIRRVIRAAPPGGLLSDPPKN